MADEEWKKAAFEDYTFRRQMKLEEVHEARQNIDLYTRLAAQREAELKELDRAAEVFGIIVTDSIADAQLEAEASMQGDDPPAFKDLAEEMLKNIYPQQVRAAEVREYVERRLKRSFHEKTAGMTLFRLSKDNVVRRIGHRNWQWIPEAERSTS